MVRMIQIERLKKTWTEYKLTDLTNLRMYGPEDCLKTGTSRRGQVRLIGMKDHIHRNRKMAGWIEPAGLEQEPVSTCIDRMIKTGKGTGCFLKEASTDETKCANLLGSCMDKRAILPEKSGVKRANLPEIS